MNYGIEALERDRLAKVLPSNLADRLAGGREADTAEAVFDHLRSLARALAGYLPRYLLQQIRADPTPGLLAGSFHAGAVAFADVSGFTAMSERLQASGREGAEEITSLVNRYFERMLTISDHYGGDLLKFGGDALMIFYEGADGSLNALSASREMQHAMQEFSEIETSVGVFPLRMSIGVGGGSIYLSNLGSAQISDHIAMGGALLNMARAEQIADAGQVVVDQIARDETSEAVVCDRVAEGFWLLRRLEKWADEDAAGPDLVDEGGGPEDIPSAVSLIEALRPYVPDQLVGQLIEDPHRSIRHGSHRPVTVIFANFYGLDDVLLALGPGQEEVISQVLNAYFLTMSEILIRHGGTISRVDSYVTGHRILAQFGALQAHEDDPLRAGRAALEMRAALPEVNRRVGEILSGVKGLRHESEQLHFNQRIGVNTGFVYAGDAGSATRREYTVMGDAVNLTARLMSAAEEGEILIGESTGQRIERWFELELQQPIQVKGKQAAVNSYLLIAERARPTTAATTRFAGRRSELAVAQQTAARAAAGEGATLIVSGVSGIGKTRLVQELISGLDAMDVLSGSGLSYGQTMAYHPWTEILRAHFGLSGAPEASDAETRLKAIRAGMEAIGEVDWTPLIGQLLGLEVQDNALTRDLDPKLRRQRVLDLCLDLFVERARRSPLLLAIDDAHWADPASLDLITYLARNIAGFPILLVVAHRVDEELAALSDLPNSHELMLQELSPEPSLQIVADMLDGASLPDELQQLILHKTGGNPFYIEELVRTLIEVEAVVQAPDGTWKASEDPIDVDLPDTIHGVVISRIDRLSATDKNLLEAAAVVGRVFDTQTLSAIHSGPIADIALRLDQLSSQGLLEPEDPGTQSYRFSHLTTQEVVYQSLSFDLRRSLHRSVGGYIELTAAGRLGEEIDLLAHHYFEGHSWPKALDFNLRSALRAQREFANETAIAAGEQAVEAGSRLQPAERDAGLVLSAHETLGEVMTLVGRYGPALENLELARKLADAAFDPPQREQRMAELSRKTAAVFERQSQYEAAMEWLDRGLGYLDPDTPRIEATEIYILKAGVMQRQGQLEAAAAWAEAGHEIAGGLTDRAGRRAQAHTSYLLGAIYYRQGDLDQAIEHCQHSVRVYEEIEDAAGLARAFNNLGSSYRMKGEWGLAREALHKSIEINRRIGDVQEQGAVTNNLGNIYLNQGDWEQAIHHFQESHAIWVKLGTILPQAITLSNLAQAHINAGNSASADTALAEAQVLHEQIETKGFVAELERRWAEYYLLVGDHDRAMQHIDRSIDLAEKQDRPRLGNSLRVLGQIQIARGQIEQAEEALQKSLNLLRELGSEYEVGRTVLSLLELTHARGGDLDRAELDRVRETFARLGARAELRRLDRLEARTAERNS